MGRTFDGSSFLSQVVAVANNTPIVMAGWLTSSLDASQRIMGVGCASGKSSCYMMSFDEVSGTKLTGLIIDAAITVDNTARTPIALSTLAHIAVVFESPTSRSVYVNGAGKVTSVVSISPTSGDFSLSAIGGAYYSGGATPTVVGSFAFPAFWKGVVFSDADILSLAQGASPRLIHPEALVSYARLTGGNSPEPDFVLPSGWTINGSSSETVNPPMFCP